MNPSDSLNDYLLIFRGPDWDRDLDIEQTEQTLDRVNAWCEALASQGKVKGGLALRRDGRIVSGKKGQLVLDGPFAESKEAIGGYLILAARDLDEAVAVAQECPTLEYGISIEVRPARLECPITERLRERKAEALA
jgi:hypothetical protein